MAIVRDKLKDIIGFINS